MTPEQYASRSIALREGVDLAKTLGPPAADLRHGAFFTAGHDPYATASVALDFARFLAQDAAPLEATLESFDDPAAPVLGEVWVRCSCGLHVEGPRPTVRNVFLCHADECPDRSYRGPLQK